MDFSASLQDIQGENLGLAKLTLDLRVKSHEAQIVQFLNVNAEVRVGSEVNHYDYDGPRNFLGYALLESGLSQIYKGQEAWWKLSLAMMPYHIQKIEEIRKKGDLFLFLKFQCLAAEMENPSKPQITRFISPIISTDGSSGSYCKFKIAQSDWMKTLKELGYGDYFLIEVPLRKVPPKKKLQKALTHLADAWTHFGEGRDEETLASCHKAFEFLAKQQKVKSPDNAAFLQLLSGVDDKEKRMKLSRLMEYICRYLNLGRHEPGEEKQHLDRIDSEYALILCQATMAYIAKRIALDKL